MSKINLKVVDLASRSATGRKICMFHLQLTGRLHGYCEEDFLLLRSMIEENDRNNISNHFLFKKRDACHSCTFAKALSKFQRRLAMIASERVTLSGTWSRKTKSH